MGISAGPFNWHYDFTGAYLRGDIDGTEDVSALIKLYEQAPPRT